jgi:hypothetical protein
VRPRAEALDPAEFESRPHEERTLEVVPAYRRGDLPRGAVRTHRVDLRTMTYLLPPPPCPPIEPPSTTRDQPSPAVELVFGVPDTETVDAAERSEVVLAGCMPDLGEPEPRWACPRCQRCSS